MDIVPSKARLRPLASLRGWLVSVTANLANRTRAVLVERVREGDTAAFAEIYSQYRPSIHAYLARRVADRDVADLVRRDVRHGPCPDYCGASSYGAAVIWARG